jgi:hypothetical protein
MGSELAVCTSATIVAEEVREVISQAAATFCIQEPTLEAKAAIHKTLKRGSRSGAHAEEGAAACPLVTPQLLLLRRRIFRCLKLALNTIAPGEQELAARYPC